MSKVPEKRAILLTIGTGDVTRAEESLLAPLRKSIRSDGVWSIVVLLPSKITNKYAEALQDSLCEFPIEIKPLPEAGMENDIDGCYAHFEAVIAGLLTEGFRNHDIFVDYTRGTKPMSSALALAAVRRDIPNLRYITSDRKDSRGQVVPGTEEIFTGTTAYVTLHRRLDAAERFFSRGNFTAVLEILPDPDHRLFESLTPEPLCGIIGAAHRWARFYAAWDRLDYHGAERLSRRLSTSDVSYPRWAKFAPRREMYEWVWRLAKPLPDDCRGKAAHVRGLAVDILANGERRLKGGQLEDACLRAFRVLELIGQIRLFDRGYDSAKLDPKDEIIQRVRMKRRERNNSSFTERKDKKTGETFYEAGRELVLSLLKELGDPMQRKLSSLATDPLMKAEKRNKSVLIHGFEPMAQTDSKAMRAFFGELAALLIEDDKEAMDHLHVARTLDFSEADT